MVSGGLVMVVVTVMTSALRSLIIPLLSQIQLILKLQRSEGGGEREREGEGGREGGRERERERF